MDQLSKLWPNFTLKEFECPCGNSGCPKDGMEYWFISALQDLRLQFGSPLRINSGFRCYDYNQYILGAEKSKHCTGIAADIAITSLTADRKHRLLRKVFYRFTGIGIYRTFVHVDLRPLCEKAFWTSL